MGCYTNVLHSLCLAEAQSEKLRLAERCWGFQSARWWRDYKVRARSLPRKPPITHANIPHAKENSSLLTWWPISLKRPAHVDIQGSSQNWGHRWTAQQFKVGEMIMMFMKSKSAKYDSLCISPSAYLLSKPPLCPSAKGPVRNLSLGGCATLCCRAKGRGWEQAGGNLRRRMASSVSFSELRDYRPNPPSQHRWGMQCHFVNTWF